MLLRRMEFELESQLAEIQELAEALDRFSKISAIPPKVLFRINLAIDELITNTITHGYAGNARRQIDVVVNRGDRHLEVELMDDGLPFNPLSVATPDTEAGIEDRALGGLGVHFVRTLIEQVEYRHDGARNIIRLTVPLGSRAEPEMSAVPAPARS